MEHVDALLRGTMATSSGAASTGTDASAAATESVAGPSARAIAGNAGESNRTDSAVAQSPRRSGRPIVSETFLGRLIRKHSRPKALAVRIPISAGDQEAVADTAATSGNRWPAPASADKVKRSRPGVLILGRGQLEGFHRADEEI